MSVRAHRAAARRAPVTNRMAAYEAWEADRELRERDEAEDAHALRPSQATRERLRGLSDV